MRTLLSFEREKQRLAKAGAVRTRDQRRTAAVAPRPGVALFRTTPDGRFVEASPGLAAMLGYAGERELLAVEPSSLYLDSEAPAEWAALLEREAGPVVYETALVRRDGTALWAHSIAHAVRGEDGRVVAHEGILEDITARKQEEDDTRARNTVLEERLREAQDRADATARDLSRLRAENAEFARVLAHDLQEPLRMVSSFVQLVSERFSLDAEAEKFIGYAVAGAARVKALLADLQGYVRISRRPDAVRTVELRQAVAEALMAIRMPVDEIGAMVAIGELPEVQGDARQLRLLFQHLIGNALKFRGGRPARISVWAERREREWEIAVRDEGIGIAPEHATQIFDIFKRLHLAAEYPGTGIGLAVSRKIVELHGGRIWVESQPGAGATFRFTLPDPEAVPQRPASPAGPHVTVRVRAAF